MNIRNPEFGNVDIIDTKVIMSNTLDDTSQIFKDTFWNQTNKLNMTFRALSSDERDALIEFFLGTAGQEISFEDHESNIWLGFILNPSIIFASEGLGCQYSTNFMFEGIKQPP